MSSLNICGFFCLASGHCVSSTKPNSTFKTYYCIYDTTVQCASAAAVGAELRIYSPMNDVILTDNMIALVFARAHILSSGGTVLLEASHLYPFPHDLSSDSYEDTIANVPSAFIFGVGTVGGGYGMLERPAKFSDAPVEKIKVFDINISDYVRNSTRLSIMQLMQVGPHWMNARVPIAGSTVHFFGPCWLIDPTGKIAISIESIVMNLGGPSVPPQVAPPPDFSSPSKCKCYVAFPSTTSSSVLSAQPGTLAM
ncbi:hypothetical protein SCP_1200680 [Sparassis crispa]|uniref:Uncharacterized protein n=1 Tax=Sparassis crispa TaxID=139825 RepID=A0A401H099_9APHY|nr:hypothetical protein SCP_1200680 [Sparassis crispa]GBE87843.1 hypothetical protein SCP_1200680 [Sparassis crispa]